MFDLRSLQRHAMIAIITIMTYELCLNKGYSREKTLGYTVLVNLALNLAEHLEVILDFINPQADHTHSYSDKVQITQVFCEQRDNFNNGFPPNP